jgi:hypothetical protein
MQSSPAEENKKNLKKNENLKIVEENRNEDERNKIEQSILKNGYDELLEDKTVDLIAVLVFNKLKPIFGQKKIKNFDNFSDSSNFDFSFISILKGLTAILSVIFMLVIISSHLGGDKPAGSGMLGMSSKLSSFFPDDKHSLIVKNFEFKRGSLIKTTEYSGKLDMVDKHIDLILTFIQQIRILAKEELDKMNNYTKQNFLLYGPPGTGKTIFVRYLLTLIDEKLKIEFINKSKGNEELKKRFKDSSDNEKKQILKMMRSRVIYCEVAPSSINGSYVGESEKNVGLLFNTANALASEEFVAIFLFFDEGDIFFEERSASSGGNQSAGNVKSELLQRIGVQPVFQYLSVFVYCATNRPAVFDDAFKRRFGCQDTFEYPNAEERREYLRFLFKDYVEMPNDVVNQILALTVGKSQAFISSQMKQFYYLKDYLVAGFYLKRYVQHLHNNRNNTSLG